MHSYDNAYTDRPGFWLGYQWWRGAMRVLVTMTLSYCTVKSFCYYCSTVPLAHTGSSIVIPTLDRADIFDVCK